MKFAPLLIACLVVAPPPAGHAADAKPRYERRWVWVMSNLLVDKEADRVEGIVEQAGRDGFNGLVLSDYKLNLLADMPPEYFKHVERIKAAAAKAKVEIIPTLFPIGYSDGLLMHDPNLAEGLPVVGSPFLVRGREAVPVPDPASRLDNGGLEATNGDKFIGVNFQDEPGKSTFADREVVHGGKVSCRMQDFAGANCRLFRTVKVRPHACYRLSCWAKTRDLSPTACFHITAAAGDRPLTFQEGEIEPTQAWKRMQVVFNTLDNAEIVLRAGLWGANSGTLWLDDFALEELPLVNVLRRPGCPVTVTSGDGRTTYVEGKDFTPVVDPKLGNVPYAGQYEFDHAAPPLRLTADSRIKDGEALRVGYYHPVIIHGQQVMCCLSEPKVFDLLRDQARRVEALFRPRTVFMGFDEVRVANWCRACQDRKQTPGAMLADSARRCVQILKETSPRARIVAWSDMFDPNHNAVAHYDLINGPLEGSWEGLAPEVIIANWNAGKARASLDFFARRGHEQILAGYYDGDDNFKTWDDAARGMPKVEGFMYTTWQARYGDLERYGKLLRGKE